MALLFLLHGIAIILTTLGRRPQFCANDFLTHLCNSCCEQEGETKNTEAVNQDVVNMINLTNDWHTYY